MSKSTFPIHLRSSLGASASACGNFHEVQTVSWRSVKKVECKNCLALIARNVKTAYFEPRQEKVSA